MQHQSSERACRSFHKERFSTAGIKETNSAPNKTLESNNDREAGRIHVKPMNLFKAKEGATAPSASSSSCCVECGGVIPALRLKAIPGATMCAPCKEAAGDEPRIKRLDDYSGREAEDVVETYFTPASRGYRYFTNVIDRLYSGQTSLEAEGEPA